MEKKTILLDSDGVIADLVSAWVLAYNEEYSDNLSVEEFASDFGGVHKVVKPECGGDVYRLIEEPNFFEKLSPIAGSIDGVRELLRNKNLNVYILTSFSSHPEIAKGKVMFFKQHIPKLIDTHSIIMCHDKYMVLGDVLVDDSLKNLRLWSDQMSKLGRYNYHAIAMAAPHNVDCPSYVDHRSENWEDLLSYINNILL